MKYLNLALESDVDLTQPGLVQELPVSPEDGEKILDIIESEGVEEKTDAELQQAAVALEALSETYNFTKAVGANANYSTHSLAVAHAQAISRLIGVKTPEVRTVSVEQYEANKDIQLHVALESITEAVLGVIDKIKKFFYRIYLWLRTKIAAYMFNIDKIKKKHSELVEKLSDCEFKESTPQSAYLRALIAYRKGDPIRNLVDDARAIDKVFEEFMSHRARGFAVAMKEAINSFTLLFDRRALDSSLRYTHTAAENVIRVLHAKEDKDTYTGHGSEEKTFRSHNLPGGLCLFVRPPVLVEKNPVGYGPYVDMTSPGMIRVRRGDVGDFGELPEKMTKALATASLDFAKFAIDAFVDVEKMFNEFPDFRSDLRKFAARDLTRSVDKGQDLAAQGASYWKIAGTLQMYYGVWQVQLMSGMLHSASALLKFVDGSIVPKKK